MTQNFEHYQIHCNKQCANCCKLAVHTTFFEAQLIAPTLDDEQKAALSDYIEKLRNHQDQFIDLKSYLRHHLNTLGPCPFLNPHDNCDIYENRPLTCRALLSTRPATWCGVDFATLDQWDKQLYEQALDRDHVTWPTHYLAATQDAAAEHENKIGQQMRDTYGFALAGNLPLMVWLALHPRIDTALSAGSQAILDLLITEKINPAWIVNLSE